MTRKSSFPRNKMFLSYGLEHFIFVEMIPPSDLTATEMDHQLKVQFQTAIFVLFAKFIAKIKPKCVKLKDLSHSF